jgi:oleandomycin transport system permease protein
MTAMSMTDAATTTAVRSARVSPLTAVRHALTLTWRSLVQIKHNPMELFDLSLQPLMFVLLFAFVFGGAIAGSPKEYLEFGLAGIIAQNALFLTLNTAVALNTDIGKGVFDRFRSLPIAHSAPLAGRITAEVVRQMWSVAILLGTGMLLGFRIHTGAAGALGAFVLLVSFSLAFSWLPVLIGILVDAPEKVQMFGFVALFPLTFASSAFVPTASMPGWLQAWVRVNPVTLLADALRGLLASGDVARPTMGALAWAATIAVVFAPYQVDVRLVGHAAQGLGAAEQRGGPLGVAAAQCQPGEQLDDARGHRPVIACQRDRQRKLVAAARALQVARRRLEVTPRGQHERVPLAEEMAAALEVRDRLVEQLACLV